MGESVTAVDGGGPGGPGGGPLRDRGLQLIAQGDYAGAQEAYQLAIDSGHLDWAPDAAHYLGMLLAGQGDVAGARAAYQLAIDSGHAEAAPAAAVNLGETG